MSLRSTSLTPGRTITGLIWQVGLVTLCRLVFNTARRFAYPFAPVLSRGLGVPLTAITSVIAVNQSTAVIGMFFGPLADRLDYLFTVLSWQHCFWPGLGKVFLIRLCRLMWVNEYLFSGGGWLSVCSSSAGREVHCWEFPWLAF